MANRGVFTLATVMMVLFFLASHFDNYFFLLHFLEAVIYAVVLILLFYGLEEWAYGISFLTPIFWAILTWLNGTLPQGLGALWSAATFAETPLVGRHVVAGLIFVAGLTLVVVSGRAFLREVYGRPGIRGAVWGSIGAVVVYYVVVILVWLRLLQPVSS